MLSVQAHELKSRFSEVLHKVENGEEVLISHKDKIIARLSPWSENKQKTTSRLEAIKTIQQFKRIKLPKGETIEDLRRIGQR